MLYYSIRNQYPSSFKNFPGEICSPENRTFKELISGRKKLKNGSKEKEAKGLSPWAGMILASPIPTSQSASALQVLLPFLFSSHGHTKHLLCNNKSNQSPPSGQSSRWYSARSHRSIWSAPSLPAGLCSNLTSPEKPSLTVISSYPSPLHHCHLTQF